MDPTLVQVIGGLGGIGAVFGFYALKETFASYKAERESFKAEREAWKAQAANYEKTIERITRERQQFTDQVLERQFVAGEKVVQVLSGVEDGLDRLADTVANTNVQAMVEQYERLKNERRIP